MFNSCTLADAGAAPSSPAQPPPRAAPGAADFLTAVSLTTAVAAFCGATAASLLLTPAVIAFANKRQMLDRPDGVRRLHAHAVPRLGGVAVFLAASIAALTALASHPFDQPKLERFVGLFIGAAIMFALGIADDLEPRSPRTKITVQSLAAAIVIYSGVRPETLVLGPELEIALGWLGIPLMWLWIVGVTNSYNLIDGLNGLAAGVAIVACAGAATMAFALPRPVSLVVIASIAGALCGFLPFNFPIARVFLGDSGSMSIGFLLACLLMLSAQRPADGAVYAPLPLAAMLLPFLDTTLAVLRRWLRNAKLSGADSRHIHHRLLALGLTVSRATVLLWAFSALLVAIGIGLVLAPPQMVASIALIGGVFLVSSFVYGAILLSYHELIVAGQVLWTGFRRARRLVTQQIHAIDARDSIRSAGSLEQVEEILAREAAGFGFMGMELTTLETTCDRGMAEFRTLTPARSWRFEYRLHPAGAPPRRAFSLSIWCDVGNATQVYGAERVARTLAPALEDRLAQAFETHPERRVAARPQGERVGLAS